MQLPEKAVLRRYNALANDWTPLSRKPCWLSNAFHCKNNYMKRNRFAWFRLLVLSTKIPPADNKLHCSCDKSFADDLVPSRYCKCESNLCITIHWDFSGVSSICSSLVLLFVYRRVASSLEIWFSYVAIQYPRERVGILTDFPFKRRDKVCVCGTSLAFRNA